MINLTPNLGSFNFSGSIIPPLQPLGSEPPTNNSGPIYETMPDGTKREVDVIIVTAKRTDPYKALMPYGALTGAEENGRRDAEFANMSPEDRAIALGMNPFDSIEVGQDAEDPYQTLEIDQPGIQLSEIVTYEFISPVLQSIGLKRIDLSFDAYRHIQLEHSGAFRGDKSDFDDRLLPYKTFAENVLVPILANPLSFSRQGGRLVVEGNLPTIAGTDRDGYSTNSVRLVLQPSKSGGPTNFDVVTAYPIPQRW
jgi:hypothetical protein